MKKKQKMQKNLVGIFQVGIFQGLIHQGEFDWWKFTGWEFSRYRKKHLDKRLSKNNCSVDLHEIKNTLLKH